jgi:hypothetical protein
LARERSTGWIYKYNQRYTTSTIGTGSCRTELEISKTSASNWELEIFYVTPPQLSLVYEQYALIKFNPTINKYFNVVPRINPQWGGNLDEAIKKIQEFLLEFDKNSFGYNRFNVFLKAFEIAKGLKYEVEETDSKHYSFLVLAFFFFFLRKQIKKKEL